VFAAVSAETGRVLGADYAAMSRYEREGVLTVMGSWNRSGPLVVPVGSSVPLDGQSAAAQVLRSGGPVRIDHYQHDTGTIGGLARSSGIRSTVAVPITTGDELWGVMALFSTKDELLPRDTEERLVRFTELVATAVANSDAREELRAIADEQAALRRVATLVAQAVPPRAVFTAVANEVGRLFLADLAFIGHFEDDDATSVVGVWSAPGNTDPVELRGPVTEQSAAGLVRSTGLPARVDGYPEGPSTIEHALGIRAAVASPIVVEGHLWGVLVVGTRGDDPLPHGSEDRLADFTELVATAIANVEANAELTESRARFVASADDTMRRIERDLHDGAQQRLITLALQLRGAQQKLPPDNDELAAQLDRLTTDLSGAMDELREFARGIHPATLTRGGLSPALRTLARRAALPVDLNVNVGGRLPEPVELAGYHVVAEALTNAATHAQATTVTINVEADDRALRIAVHDDGIGGADFGRGLGLVGLRDRVDALGGHLALDSEPGRGTSLSVALPVPSPATHREAG
jgi:signal transduction histidine kinase